MLAGAEEFLPDLAPGAPVTAALSSITPDNVRRAYDRIGVDAGYLSSAAAAWFRVGRALPINFTEVTTAPVVRRLTAGGVSVAVVHFPPLPQGDEAAALPDRLRAVIEAARSVADAQLVVGVSPWGFMAEDHALPHLEEAFHVLIGGGSGAPFPAHSPKSAPGLLWLRPTPDGKNVQILDIRALPARTADRPAFKRPWLADVTFESRDATLTPDIPDDTAVAELLR